jgi:hypothetical protein
MFWLLAFGTVDSLKLIVDRGGRPASPDYQLSTINYRLIPSFFPPSPLPHAFGKRLALGKLYPVTAAQLLPIYTGFLAPIHRFKLAKN